MHGDALLGVIVGIGLAAACGFRVFVPLLIMSAATQLGWFAPTPAFAWLATTPALLAFAVATAVEIAAAHVPWLDHLLDVAAAPLAIAAGTTAMAASLGDGGGFLRWALSIIAGGGVAGLFHSLNGMVRASSTVATAGLANPAFATLETGGAVVLTVGALLLPVVALVLAAACVAAALRLVLRRKGD